MKQYYTAIIFFNKEKNEDPRKYRNINNLDNFNRFAANLGAWYYNLYDRATKQYKGRHYL